MLRLVHFFIDLKSFIAVSFQKEDVIDRSYSNQRCLIFISLSRSLFDQNNMNICQGATLVKTLQLT